MSPATAALRTRLEEAGQDHLLAHLDRLEGEPRARLVAELEALDLALVRELARLLRAPAAPRDAQRFEPPATFPLARGPAEEERARRAIARGEELLAAGRVGFVLVAGGQASRLGFEGPKGVFPVGPVSGRTLFALHARRLLRARRRHGIATPWYVMTSDANDAATRAYFEEHAHFGLPAADVRFFRQEMLPALDEEGRILLAARDALFLAPNGHGGVLTGLRRSGALADMRARGLTQLSYFQVDNPLVRPTDPLFLGLHDLEGAQMSTKVVAKRDAGEKVGVIGCVDGRLGCVEYSDLPDELRFAAEPGGALRFRAGNIAVHALSIDFLDELTDEGVELPWHVAEKRMSVLDARGRSTEARGYKFETFVFDALGKARHSVTLEVDRALEFSPVKNATGEDSPRTAQRDLCRLHAGWACAAGRELPAPGELGVPAVEIDPLLAETEEEFLALDDPRPHVHERGHLYE
jgi:UDP-N-acetylglucosamine/UDP-N-acetylgalactosamine diphosphorylase